MEEYHHRALVSADNRLGLYIAIPIYFCILGVAAFISYRKLNKQVNDGSTDYITGHFLAGRSFGPMVTAGTVFASLFSGYTVVGIPNECFKVGYYGFRWVPSFAIVAAACMCTGVRLRKASVVRNHHTPVDFLTDRFRSQLLRYTIVVIGVMASIVYLAAQVNALRSTFNAMFGIPQSNVGPVLGIMAVILLFEWAGGLAVIAMSDNIQGFIMLLSFIMVPSVMMKNYGGWKDLDPFTYPRPDFYQSQSLKQQWQFWQFSIINLSFFALPHLMMRIYAARDLRALRGGFYAMTIGPWCTMFVGVFIGTVGVQVLSDAGVDIGPDGPAWASPFTSILDQLIGLGGFPEAVGIIALTSSLAAIMSTADSLIIAISQLVTVECVWPFLQERGASGVVWIGRITSLVSTILACIMGLLWKEGVSALTAINFPIIIQSVPAYIYGLYATEIGEMHPFAIISGAWVGILYVFLFFFLYLYENPSAAGVNAGITGVLLNVLIIWCVEFFIRRRSGKSNIQPSWDVPAHKRFGEHQLTSKLLDMMMEGFDEPLRKGWFIIGLFVSASICTPWLAEGQPSLTEDTSIATYPYTSDPVAIRGVPYWFFKQILLTIIPYSMAFYVVWNMPNVYPFNEKKVDTEGINPDVIEMTAEELNVRPGFDVANESIKSRRSLVSSKMEELGISLKTELEEEDKQARPQMEKRLSSVVLGKILETSNDEEEGDASNGDDGNGVANNDDDENGNTDVGVEGGN